MSMKLILIVAIILVVFLTCCTTKEEIRLPEAQVKVMPEVPVRPEPVMPAKVDVAEIPAVCPNGEVVCNEEASFCSRQGKLTLLEDCQYGCDEATGKCFEEFYGAPTGNCVEAIPGHNDLSKNRINLVFLGFNYDNPEIFRFFVNSAIDLDSNYYGLLSVEPFKSNKDKFNFWYVDEIQYIGDIKMADYGEITPSGVAVFKKIRQLPVICNYTNQQGIALYNGVGGNAAIVGFPDKKISVFPDCGPSDLNGDGCIDKKDLDLIEARNLNIEGFNDCYRAHYGCQFDTIPDDARVFYYSTELFNFVHEFGHSFGLLNDEYRHLGAHFESSPRATNCFTASSKEECLTNAPWKKLMGQGCGDGTKIDCTPEDENYSLEIGCFEGCFYIHAGIYRPTLLSIMGGQDTESMDTFTTAHSFRLVNEQLLCKRITELTGSAGGYCNRFNSINP